MSRNFLQTLFACALPFCVNAMADTAVTVDAKQNCVNTSGKLTGGKAASTQLSAGRYVASLINDSMNCSATASCTIDTVVLQAAGNASTTSLTWGLAVKTGNPVTFDISANGLTLTAIVLDPSCSDNTGSATLLLQPVN